MTDTAVKYAEKPRLWACAQRFVWTNEGVEVA